MTLEGESVIVHLGSNLLEASTSSINVCLYEKDGVCQAMESNARLQGKRRFAGLIVIVTISIGLVGISVGMLTRFADYHKAPKHTVALIPSQTSTTRIVSTPTPDVTPTHTQNTPTPTSTVLPSSTATPTSTVLPSSAATPTNGTTPQTTVTASPLLFGTNLTLKDGNDQVLTSSVTQNLLQQIHVQVIRMPMRADVSEAVNVQAAQTIKQLSAAPLIILRGAQDTQALKDNTLVITDMNRVFGSSVVYYEFGNENDFQGVSAPAYTTAWNSVIPSLKRLALNGQFIGPVNFHYDRAYLTYFLAYATPRPDAVSWHEYACWASDATSICMAHLANWTTHIQDARAIISTTGKMLPIMITEWNYDANASLNDGKSNNSTFMRTWTTAALQTLANNNVFASMQFSCTDTVMPLVTPSGTLTPQGNAFLTAYQQIALHN